MLSNLLTNSRMQTNKTCMKKGFLAYELGLRRIDQAKPLRLGSPVHIGLDLAAKGTPQNEAISAAVAGYETLPAWATTDEDMHEWLIERETVARLLSGYFWRWGAGADDVA